MGPLLTLLSVSFRTFVSSSVSDSRRKMICVAGSDPPPLSLSVNPASKGATYPASDKDLMSGSTAAEAVLLSGPASQCEGLGAWSISQKHLTGLLWLSGTERQQLHERHGTLWHSEGTRA